MMHQSIQLLLIEDSPSDARLIQEMLAQAHELNHRLVSVERLAAGLQHLENQAIDLILLDLTLPDSGGLNTLITLHGRFPNIPVVVLTGFDDAETGVQAVQEGAQDYLVKDEVNNSLLRRTIRYALERHRIEEALRKREEEYRSLIDDVFDNSSVAVFILDQDFKIVWVNEATETYFGLEREAVIGQDKRQMILERIRYIFAEPDEFAQAILFTYENNVFPQSFRCQILADPQINRKHRWVEHWSQPIRAGLYAGGRIEQYMDITEHKRIEAAEHEQRVLAEALSDSAGVLTSTLDFDEVLNRILDNVGYVVPHNTAKIMLINDGVARVVRARNLAYDDPLDPHLGAQVAIQNAIYLRYMAETGNYVTIPDIQTDSDWVQLPGDQDLHSCVAAPIRLQAETVGFISLLTVNPNELKSIHAERLQLFTTQAAIAIQNARHYEQTRELAAIEERQRIAQDLHDAVSQNLFSASIIAQSLPRLWNRKPETILSQLKQLDELTQGALIEMRMLLMELRPETFREVSMVELLGRLVKTWQTRRQIPIAATVGEVPDLPLDVKIALYRIAQETLNNVAKHALATQVDITLSHECSTVNLKIQDNGVGFDTDQVAPDSFGLGIMCERAEKIGARISIETQQPGGTILQVRWSAEAND